MGKSIAKQRNDKEIFRYVESRTTLGKEDNDINVEGIPCYKMPQPDRELEMDDSNDEEDDKEVLTECEEAADNDSDSEGDSDSN